MIKVKESNKVFIVLEFDKEIIDENVVVNSVVGIFFIIDFDFGDIFIYVLVVGEGDIDN